MAGGGGGLARRLGLRGYSRQGLALRSVALRSPGRLLEAGLSQETRGDLCLCVPGRGSWSEEPRAHLGCSQADLGRRPGPAPFQGVTEPLCPLVSSPADWGPGVRRLCATAHCENDGRRHLSSGRPCTRPTDNPGSGTHSAPVSGAGDLSQSFCH